MTANFDEVAVKADDGSLSRMSAEVFSKMPITERVRLVSRGLVVFYRRGEVIRAAEAFKKVDSEKRGL